jgi:plastocyanin
MNKTSLYAVIVVVVLVVLGSGYYLYTKSSSSSPTSSLYATPTPKASPTPSNIDISPTTTPTPSTSSATKEFTITGHADAFSPSQLTVNKGDIVKITFKPTDTTHTFTLPDFNVDTGNVSSGQTKTVQFVANKSGSFQFYCTIHKSMGMTGMLIVQ